MPFRLNDIVSIKRLDREGDSDPAAIQIAKAIENPCPE